MRSWSPPRDLIGGSVATGPSGTRATKARYRLRMQPGTFVRKAAKDDARQRRRSGQRVGRCRDRDLCGTVGRESERAGGNCREGYRRKPIGLAEFDCATITRREVVILTLVATVPDRPNGMNYVPRRQPIAFGDLGIAGFAAMQRAAFGKQFGSSRIMYIAIDAATTKQRRIGGVDDGVNAQGRDVGDDDLAPRRADLAAGQAQATALTATPLSASSCCNSPAWNISRMMSQPPTNSPLT
jgi:hypothetical protein